MRDKWWIEKDGVACSVIPKNGSTSIRNALASSELLSGEEVRKFKTRVSFIRDPLDRLQSAYSFFHFLNKTSQNGMKEVSEEVTKSWESFVDYTLKVDNPHWNPQVDMLCDEMGYIPTHTYKLSQIHDVWERHWQGFYPWVCNKVTRLETSDYRVSELKEKYKRDIELWHSL